MGIEATIVPQSNVLDGINVVRRMLGRTWIDVNRCDRAIEALRQYRREYDDRLEGLEEKRIARLEFALR
jgi:phage terminase large subunit